MAYIDFYKESTDTVTMKCYVNFVSLTIWPGYLLGIIDDENSRRRPGRRR